MSPYIMHQFEYIQFVLRDPSDFDPHTTVHKDVDVLYDDFLNYLVPDETRYNIASSDCSCAFIYIQLYFRASHPYMTPYVR